jgi:hypothetical protein
MLVKFKIWYPKHVNCLLFWGWAPLSGAPLQNFWIRETNVSPHSPIPFGEKGSMLELRNHSPTPALHLHLTFDMLTPNWINFVPDGDSKWKALLFCLAVRLAFDLLTPKSIWIIFFYGQSYGNTRYKTCWKTIVNRWTTLFYFSFHNIRERKKK